MNRNRNISTERDAIRAKIFALVLAKSNFTLILTEDKKVSFVYRGVSFNEGKVHGVSLDGFKTSINLSEIKEVKKVEKVVF